MHSNNCVLIVANTRPKNYWTKILGVVGKGQCFVRVADKDMVKKEIKQRSAR